MSVKGEGGVPPKSVTFFLPKILSVKGGGGGGTPLTDKIRKVVFEVLPKKSYHSMLGLEITLIRKLEHEKERIFVSCTLFATSLDLSNGVFAQALQKLLPFD